MTSKLKIAIAIPTYNRLEKLKFALDKIEAQEIDDRFELYCVISNVGSKDGTFEFLEQLKSDKIQYVIWNKPEENIYVNWRRVTEAIPADIDWVWFHGDDDFLTGPAVVKGLVEIIESQADEKLSLIHICQARRSRNTGKIIRGSLFELCNQLGYHEMLGWMSSLVVRKRSFVPAMLWATKPSLTINPNQFLENKISAYRQSAGLLRECHTADALFVDAPWVEPQDQEQTPESIERWQETHEGERYFFVVDDLIKMYEEKILSRPLRPNFFRYLTYSLWDRYASNVIAMTLSPGGLDKKYRMHLERIAKIAQFFAVTRDKKLFLQWHHALSEMISMHEQAFKHMELSKGRLMTGYKNANESSYPFQVLGESGEILG